MTERDYRCFLEVARCLNFTEAARRLFISQPALSRQIASLEEKLGVPLFVRTHQEVKLTPGGLVLINRAEELEAGYRRMLEEARDANEGKTGKLRIALQDGQSMDVHLLALIERFRRQYENVVLDAECLPYREMLEGIRQGELDVGIGLQFDREELSDLNCRAVNTTPSYVVLSTSHPLAKADELDINGLAKEELLVVNNGMVPHGVDFTLGNCKACGIFPKGVRQAGSYSTLYLWLSMGLGFALMNQNVWYQNRRMRFYQLPDSVDITQAAYWGRDNRNPAVPLFLAAV